MLKDVQLLCHSSSALKTINMEPTLTSEPAFGSFLPSLLRFAHSQESTMNQRRSYAGPASAEQPDCNCWQQTGGSFNVGVDCSFLGPCKSIVWDSAQLYLSIQSFKKPPRCFYGLWCLCCRWWELEEQGLNICGWTQ